MYLLISNFDRLWFYQKNSDEESSDEKNFDEEY